MDQDNTNLAPNQTPANNSDGDFLSSISNQLNEIETKARNLEKLQSYDDVQAILAYVPPLRMVAQNPRLGQTPKQRLKHLHVLATKLYDELAPVFSELIIKETSVPDAALQEARTILSLSGRTSSQIEDIIQNPDALQDVLYTLKRACEAAASGVNANGNIDLPKSEDYLYNYFADQIESVKRGAELQTMINNNSTITNNQTPGISSDINK